MGKVSYFCKFFKNKWQYEHITRAPPRALDGTHEKRGLSAQAPLALREIHPWSFGKTGIKRFKVKCLFDIEPGIAQQQRQT